PQPQREAHQQPEGEEAETLEHHPPLAIANARLVLKRHEHRLVDQAQQQIARQQRSADELPAPVAGTALLRREPAPHDSGSRGGASPASASSWPGPSARRPARAAMRSVRATVTAMNTKRLTV